MAKTKKKITKSPTKTKRRRTTQVSASKFNGAEDVYLTKNKIAIRRTKSTIDKSGNITFTDTTRYVPKTAANLKAAKKAHGKLRHGRK